MPPLSYPDLSWSGRVSRLVRTLQIVAIAGTAGAVGGGIGVLALMGLPGSAPHHQVRADVARASTPPHPATVAPPVFAAAPMPATAAAAAPAPSVQTTARPSGNEATVAVQANPARPASAASTFAWPQWLPAPHRVAKSRAPIAQQARIDAAEGSRPAARTLYDRADPAQVDGDGADRSLPAEPKTANRGNPGGKRVRKRTATSTPQEQSPPTRYAPRPVVALPPPVAIVPPPPAGEDEGGWRSTREAAGGYSNRDDWNDRRRYDNGDRGSSEGPFGGGLFGLFGGSDWRD